MMMVMLLVMILLMVVMLRLRLQFLLHAGSDYLSDGHTSLCMMAIVRLIMVAMLVLVITYVSDNDYCNGYRVIAHKLVIMMVSKITQAIIMFYGGNADRNVDGIGALHSQHIGGDCDCCDGDRDGNAAGSVDCSLGNSYGHNGIKMVMVTLASVMTMRMRVLSETRCC